MSKFNFIKTDIPDVQIIEPTVFGTFYDKEE